MRVRCGISIVTVKVMFSKVCVKNSVQGGGLSMHWGRHPPGRYPSMHWGQTPSWAGIPACTGADILGQADTTPMATAADGTDPTGMLSCSPKCLCTVASGIR